MSTKTPPAVCARIGALAAVLAAGVSVPAAMLPVDVANRQAVVALYHNEYTPGNNVATGWTSSGGACNPGTTSAAFQAAVIDRINYYRSMAGVPAVAHNATYTQRAQAAAHLISVNNQSSHNPTSSWTCFTTTALLGAQRSNLFLGRSGMAAIDGYVRGDGPGNEPVGHRRWVLNPPAKAFGVGDVPASAGNAQANALYVVDVASNASHPATRDGFVAWPPPGYVPYDVVYPRWHYSQQGVDFSAASVSLTLGGQSVPAQVVATGTENLLGYLSFKVNNMGNGASFSRPSSDQRYTVTIRNAKVGGVARTIAYNVTLIDPVVIAGDANFDGVVDAADYSVIRDGLGTEYSQADLQTWRNAYGSQAGSAAVAVPEPATACLVLAAAAGAPARRRRPASSGRPFGLR